MISWLLFPRFRKELINLVVSLPLRILSVLLLTVELDYCTILRICSLALLRYMYAAVDPIRRIPLENRSF